MERVSRALILAVLAWAVMGGPAPAEQDGSITRAVLGELVALDRTGATITVRTAGGGAEILRCAPQTAVLGFPNVYTVDKLPDQDPIGFVLAQVRQEAPVPVVTILEYLGPEPPKVVHGSVLWFQASAAALIIKNNDVEMAFVLTDRTIYEAARGLLRPAELKLRPGDRVTVYYTEEGLKKSARLVRTNLKALTN